MSGRAAGWLLGLALAVAFSPGLYDLVRHWVLHPWARYGALFVVLSLWLVTRAPSAKPRPALGLAAIGLGLGVQLLAALSAVAGLARPAVVLGFVGFLWLRGLAPPGVLAVAVWIVPVPHQVTVWTGGEPLAGAWFRVGAGITGALGLRVAAGANRVAAGDAELALLPAYGGLPLAMTALGLASYAACRLRPAPAEALPGAVLLVALCALGKLLSVVLACGALAAGSVAAAELAAGTLVWMLPAAIWVGLVERRAVARAAA